ncbi:MAG: hypothetical protein CMO81_08170 [Waddliaceae bacterium]|nr:hypothetical protein [Waddliaceae bacterium]
MTHITPIQFNASQEVSVESNNGNSSWTWGDFLQILMDKVPDVVSILSFFYPSLEEGGLCQEKFIQWFKRETIESFLEDSESIVHFIEEGFKYFGEYMENNDLDLEDLSADSVFDILSTIPETEDTALLRKIITNFLGFYLDVKSSYADEDLFMQDVEKFVAAVVTIAIMIQSQSNM